MPVSLKIKICWVRRNAILLCEFVFLCQSTAINYESLFNYTGNQCNICCPSAIKALKLQGTLIFTIATDEINTKVFICACSDVTCKCIYSYITTKAILTDKLNWSPICFSCFLTKHSCFSDFKLYLRIGIMEICWW